MSLGALFGAAAALALVLVVLGLGLRAANRIARGGGFGLGGGRGPLDVVARVGLGPRQGLAVVRVGERGVLVSVGDGGIRPVLELSEAELAELAGADRPSRGSGTGATAGAGARLIRLFRSTAVLAALAAAPALVAPAPLEAQTAPSSAAPAAGVVDSTAAAAAARAAAIDSAAAALFPRLDLQVGDDDGGLRLSGTVGTVVVIGLLTLLPTLLLLMTSFTRILVVLHFLRQALGTQSAPPAHLLAALALLLTGFVMAPTLSEVNAVAFRPWTEGRITEGEMIAAAADPLRAFMLRQTRDEDLATFLELGGTGPVAGPEEVPTVALVSAFAVGELRTAFQIGFAIFLPFMVIDLVVAAVLTSMGMFMLPPTMIALPLKLMLFVLVDGWTLVVQSLVASFH